MQWQLNAIFVQYQENGHEHKHWLNAQDTHINLDLFEILESNTRRRDLTTTKMYGCVESKRRDPTFIY